MNVEAMCSKNEVASRRTLPASLADLKIDAIIALIDMDCFYVQVELRREPEFRGKPACVVQYKTRHKGGGYAAELFI
jgi:impB/mucB/samB family